MFRDFDVFAGAPNQDAGRFSQFARARQSLGNRAGRVSPSHAAPPCAGFLARVAKGGNLLHAAMERRFSNAAELARRAGGKDSGKITIAEGDYIVVCDLPKKVIWNQSELERIADELAGMGENPKDYIKIDLTVAETAFKAWPKSLQVIFAPAHTVSTGKPTYSLRRGEAA